MKSRIPFWQKPGRKKKYAVMFSGTFLCLIGVLLIWFEVYSEWGLVFSTVGLMLSGIGTNMK